MAAVRVALNASDPVGLLADGAPIDEYESEVGTIVPRVTKAQNVDEVREAVHEEFARWFGA